MEPIEGRPSMRDVKTAQDAPVDKCGPMPERPTQLSPQAVKDRWIEWHVCKAGG